MSTETEEMRAMLRSAAFELHPDHNKPAEKASRNRRSAIGYLTFAVICIVLSLLWRLSSLLMAPGFAIAVSGLAVASLVFSAVIFAESKPDYTDLVQDFYNLTINVYDVKLYEFYTFTTAKLQNDGCKALRERAQVHSGLKQAIEAWLDELAVIPKYADCLAQKTIRSSEQDLEDTHDMLADAGIIEGIPDGTTDETFIERCRHFKPTPAATSSPQ